MAVDSFRSAFHFNRVEADEIGFLISAQSYRPEITRAIRTIKNWSNWKKLQDICTNTISPGPHPKYSISGHPCLKTRNVLGLIASTDEIDWVSPIQAATLKRFFVQNENILLNLTGAGSIGRVSIYFGNSQPLTNQHIARLEINQSYDSSYVCSFLSSWWGERAIEQGISGTTGQLNLVNDHVRSLPIPIPDRLVQNYIGDKVRLAEKLRERSKELEFLTNQILDKVVPNYDTYPKKTSRVNSKILESRLDTQPYRTNFLSLNQSICQVNNSKLGEIASFSSGDPVPSKRFQSSGIPLVRIRDISKNGFINPEIFLPDEYTFKKQQYLAKPGTIVIGMDGEFRAQFFIEEELPQFINQRIAIIDSKDIRPELLSLWLNRSEGQYQLNRWAVKTTVEHTSLDDIKKILIPRINIQLENELADNILFIRRANWFGYQLTTAAKYLVEALIEGKLTETELKNAQTAYEKGDIEPDKAILAKLTRKGYDIANEPSLFPDLDALYQAIGGIDL